MFHRSIVLFLIAISLRAGEAPTPPAELVGVARLPVQITGVAVGADGRLFVNSPAWGLQGDWQVAEVGGDGLARPYPDAAWNRDRGDPQRRFVCVQAVYIDPLRPSTMWVVDPASPGFAGVVPGGAKLLRIDLATDRVERVYPIPAAVAPERSYLNDVRVERSNAFAYLTDSGLGALVVVDLHSGACRRVLGDHPATRAADDFTLQIGDWRGSMRVHADGIALDRDDRWLYFHALTGRTLYRVPTALLRDPATDAAALGQAVEDLGADVACDGMWMASDGSIYLSAIERGAVVRRHPDGRLETMASHSRLAWPDTFAQGPGGIYVTASQIHLMPAHNGGRDRTRRWWTVFRMVPRAAEDE